MPHIQPRKALNKAYLKVKPSRSEIEKFKANLIGVLDQIKEDESEEFHKNLVSDFLKKTYYDPAHSINTKGRNDMVIHNGKDAKTTVGVILEAKKPSNKAEMLKLDEINCKALQELLLYYLRERITSRNLEIKHIVGTSINEWFIFDGQIFEKAFAQNKALVKQFTDFEEGRLAGTKTEFFYKEIASPAIESVKDTLEFAYFDIRDYNKILRNADKTDDNKLIALYKLLAPEHLLKLPFANDSNSLDKTFYTELLHIIGLTEIKDGGKKIIERKKNGERNAGSLLENAIEQLDSLDKLSRLEKPSQFGNTAEERLFTVGLELVITWINRILFLKLLEAQLITYHKGDKSYAFLSHDRIHDYDDLNSLFFSVLAKKETERKEEIKQAFARVPYLNSSLFEPTEMEHTTIFISNLRNERTLPVLSSTVLKTSSGKKRTGDLDALTYLFEFLSAYDFSSEGSEEIQEDNKTLINASVLGLIFEKINGYKDGSFFTPGFITMYMCRETIRRAVVQKFKEAGYNLAETSDVTDSFRLLYDQIESTPEGRNKANEIVNSLKICDPAVGSGHFLVSALNELISIKSDLRILQDREGRRLKEYQLEVVNDELVVTDEEGELFEYRPGNKESQRVQETLFHEKQTIIENCLFGVDINPNSVKICRLRLWIELLKNAYYRMGTEELETLPNIDINIKTGNSLISRFALDADIKQALKKSKWSIDSYRLAVQTYREAKSKEEKREMEQLINDIKSDFRTEINKNDPKLNKLFKLNGELTVLTTQKSLFEMTAKEKKTWSSQVEKLTAESKKLEVEIEEIRNNKVYENAFEWRFEFPEVLDIDGYFMGFDVVIGNPPYIRIQDLVSTSEATVNFYNGSYRTTGKGNYDLYVPFVEMGLNLLKGHGDMAFIMPHKFINSNYGRQLRGFIAEGAFVRELVHFGANQIFEDATTYTGLFFFSKEENTRVKFSNLDEVESFKQGVLPSFQYSPLYLLTEDQWTFLSAGETALLDKIQSNAKPLENVTDRIFQGVKTSADKIYIVQVKKDLGDDVEILCKENDQSYVLEKTYLLPLIKGGNSRAYVISDTNLMLLFPYEDGRLVDEATIRGNAPMTWSYLLQHKLFLEGRENNKMIGEKWYGYVYPKALNVLSRPKLFTPDIAPSPRFSFDRAGIYSFTGGAAGGYGIIPKEAEDFKYLLALLNSKVAFWFIKKTSTQMRGGWFSFESRYIKNIPIATPSKSQKSEIESLVDKVLKMHNDSEEKDASDLIMQIDQLVFGLYGLTAEEISLVESS
jgi:adenine-specific DNA-methyltransferase